MLNYTNVASECGVSQRDVRSYFQILDDTFLGFRISPWTKSLERRLIQTEKFYLFDVGVSNYLARRVPKLGSSESGKSFEHFILMELNAYKAYRSPELSINFWGTASQIEVDFILGDKDLAIEIKGKPRVINRDLKSLRSIVDDGPVKTRVVVCLENEPRLTEDNIWILPWKEFLKRLWGGEYNI